MIRYLFLICLFTSSVVSQQPTLQPWIQVYGTVAGQGLGANVTGIKPTANLPYRAAVSHGGLTSFYRLSNPTDTAAQLTVTGTNLLLGDLNNDGWIDAVVSGGSNGYDTVLIYWGTPTGLDIANPLRIPGENQYDGLRPSCIGDINNDGKPDLILTSRYYPYPDEKGKVYIYLNPIATITPYDTVVGDSISFALGTICTIGDLNNDGFNDLIVRGSKLSGPQSRWYDYINIYWGVGVDSLNLKLGTQLKSLSIVYGGLACFDVNGDGIADLLWTHGDTGSTNDIYNIFVHFGGASFSSTPSLRSKIQA